MKTVWLQASNDGEHYRVSDFLRDIGESLCPYEGGKVASGPRWVAHLGRYFVECPVSVPEDLSGADGSTWTDRSGVPVADPESLAALCAIVGRPAPLKPVGGPVVEGDLSVFLGTSEFDDRLEALIWAQLAYEKTWKKRIAKAAKDEDIIVVNETLDGLDRDAIRDTAPESWYVSIDRLMTWLKSRDIAVAIRSTRADPETSTAGRKGGSPADASISPGSPRLEPAGMTTPQIAKALKGTCDRDEPAWARFLSTPPPRLLPAREHRGNGRPALWNPLRLAELLAEHTAGRPAAERFKDQDKRQLFNSNNQFMLDEWRQLWRQRQDEDRENFGR